jgi:orotidine-5'-phosphate decarboxylase
MCIDAAIAETDAKTKKAFDDWVNTRGCILGNTSDSTIKQTYKPCYPTFKDAKIGDIRPTVAGYANMRLLSWVPDKPSSFVPT